MIILFRIDLNSVCKMSARQLEVRTLLLFVSLQIFQNRDDFAQFCQILKTITVGLRLFQHREISAPRVSKFNVYVEVGSHMHVFL